jgi:drug/metabolite transporter (DMT)-like permease
MLIYYILVLLSVFIAACAQMLLKKATKGTYESAIRQYLNIWVISAYGIMMGCMLINIYCMSKGVGVKSVGIIESMSYVFVPFLSWRLYKERLSKRKIGAVLLIMLGIIIFFC